MSADLLREAATILRERAETVVTGDGPTRTTSWFADRMYGASGYEVIAENEGSIIAEDLDGTAAEWVALMHPGVGLALADLLDIEATRLDDTTVCDAPTQCSNCSAPHWSFVPAMEIASLIVGGQS